MKETTSAKSAEKGKTRAARAEKAAESRENPAVSKVRAELEQKIEEERKKELEQQALSIAAAAEAVKADAVSKKETGTGAEAENTGTNAKSSKACLLYTSKLVNGNIRVSAYFIFCSGRMFG